jgi:hypothetical protein
MLSTSESAKSHEFFDPTAIHVAEAIGALLVGLVLAETEHRQRIEHLVFPFRDFFGAMFFLHFGLTINPYALGGAVWPALAAAALTLVGNFAAGMLAGRSARLSPRASANIGLTILPWRILHHCGQFGESRWFASYPAAVRCSLRIDPVHSRAIPHHTVAPRLRSG